MKNLITALKALLREWRRERALDNFRAAKTMKERREAWRDWRAAGYA